MGKMEKKEIETLINKIIGLCIDVHNELGPGFLESIYHRALEIKFADEKLYFESKKEVPVYYHDRLVGTHKLDFLIEGEVVLELEIVEEIHKKYYAQVRSYLNAIDREMGLLVNFADIKVDIMRVERKR